MTHMIASFFFTLFITILSAGLANTLSSLNQTPVIGFNFQPVSAANTISNQTTTTNLDCDSTSTCSQDNFQLATISSGDRNSISQKTSQGNLHCHNVSVCNEESVYTADIGAKQSADILAAGNNNEIHDQISDDANSINQNTINQQLDQKNQNCQGITSCQQYETRFTDIGASGNGVIFLTISNNNNITKSISNTDSGNKNNVGTQVLQTNNGCKDMQEEGCHNDVIVSNSLISNSVNDFLGSEGDNNTGIQSIRNAESGNKNTVSQYSSQDNEACHNASGCGNIYLHDSELGNSGNGFMSNINGNNTSIQDISNTGSYNENTVLQKSNQANNNCSNAAGCFNFAQQSSRSEIGNGLMFNIGENNFIRTSITNNNSSNNNKVEQQLTQQNNNCDGSLCANDISSTYLGSTDAGGISNAGNNNNISTSVINIDSNNDNKIKQDASQINFHCSASSSCNNSGIEFAGVGIVKLPFIITSESNTAISNNSSNISTNNNNAISQNMDQSNLCRDQSNCNNSGNLTANINGQNNQNIDQSLTQKNLCLEGSTCNNDGKVVGISGSNTQSNICLKNSACSNNGTNNNSICLSGSSCTNSGIDTKVISKDSSCSSGVDGSTTICTHGRIISVGKDPEKNA